MEDNARLDIAACGFWGGRFEKAFFDVRVFNPCAQLNYQSSLQATCRHHEQEKRRHYDQHKCEIEHGTFTPQVLSTMGGMGRAATFFYKRLASLLSEKWNENYSQIMGWVCCRLSFALLGASFMCIRDAHSSRNRPVLDNPIDLQLAETQISFFFGVALVCVLFVCLLFCVCMCVCFCLLSLL